jgi:carbon monoxide dehydrogenase subunit G
MFTVKASVNEQFDIAAPLAAVRDFFSRIENFAELMPGVARAYKDASGIGHLTIEAAIPLVGKITQQFTIEPAEESEDRIEWIPKRGEAQNLLRYSADFLPGGEGTTVQFAQAVELRRNKARDLHFLAGMAGESLLSSKTSEEYVKMVKQFIQKARARLEGAVT